jgi:hypothetical protein
VALSQGTGNGKKSKKNYDRKESEEENCRVRLCSSSCAPNTDPTRRTPIGSEKAFAKNLQRLFAFFSHKKQFSRISRATTKKNSQAAQKNIEIANNSKLLLHITTTMD